jgi:hypothetical protein
MFLNFQRLSAIAVLGLALGTTLAPAPSASAQTQPSAIAQAKPNYKTDFDRRQRLIDRSCNRPQTKRFEGLTYELCRMEDVLTRVSMEGPPGDNGPTAYFYGGKLYAFRDTGSGQAWIFQNGKLMAEIEIGTVAPAANLITTTFSPQERKKRTDWATQSSRRMLKVFGSTLRL